MAISPSGEPAGVGERAAARYLRLLNPLSHREPLNHLLVVPPVLPSLGILPSFAASRPVRLVDAASASLAVLAIHPHPMLPRNGTNSICAGLLPMVGIRDCWVNAPFGFSASEKYFSRSDFAPPGDGHPRGRRPIRLRQPLSEGGLR